MKKMQVLIVIALMLGALFFVISPVPAKAEGNISGPPQPGSISWGSNIKSGSDIRKYMDIEFAENDAYLSGWTTYPYEFEYGLYMHKENQRVIVDVWLRNYTGSINIDDGSGHHMVIDYTEDSSYLKSIMQAEIFQKGSWKDANFGSTSDVASGYIQPDMAEQTITQGTWQNAQTDHWRFSFLTNSSYTPGVFGVKIRIKVHWSPWYAPWIDNTGWEELATIYGKFSVGDFWVPTDNPPNDVEYNPNNNTWTPAQFNLTIQNGKYRIKFWYAGQNGTWNFNGTSGNLTGPEVKLMKVYPSTTSYYTRDDSPVHVEYPFDGTQPAGAYIWEVVSYSHTGETLMAWTLVISNNYTSQQVINGTIHDYKPKLSIEFNSTGTPHVNGDLTIIVHAYDNDSTYVNVWLIVFYSNNLYEAPPPWISTMQIFNYPLHIFLSNMNGSASLKIQLKYGGQLNVYVWGKDDGGAFSAKRAFIMIQDFQGASGGGSISQPNWLMFPWQSTANMVLLLFGVLLMFTRRPTLQIIGIFLFFGAFVNWHYVSMQIQAGVNPMNWFKHI